MKTHMGERVHTDSFQTRHRKSWHNGWSGVGKHLHFWVCSASCE